MKMQSILCAVAADWDYLTTPPHESQIPPINAQHQRWKGSFLATGHQTGMKRKKGLQLKLEPLDFYGGRYWV